MQKRGHGGKLKHAFIEENRFCFQHFILRTIDFIFHVYAVTHENFCINKLERAISLKGIDITLLNFF